MPCPTAISRKVITERIHVTLARSAITGLAVPSHGLWMRAQALSPESLMMPAPSSSAEAPVSRSGSMAQGGAGSEARPEHPPKQAFFKQLLGGFSRAARGGKSWVHFTHLQEPKRGLSPQRDSVTCPGSHSELTEKKLAPGT